jgi:hypothetical protein
VPGKTAAQVHQRAPAALGGVSRRVGGRGQSSHGPKYAELSLRFETRFLLGFDAPHHEKTTASALETMRKMPAAACAADHQDDFQATAQIVETEGEAGLSTNKMACKPGFSISALWYFQKRFCWPWST